MGWRGDNLADNLPEYQTIARYVGDTALSGQFDFVLHHATASRVWADDVAASREQLAMFASKPRRDLRAANEALARVRAELGDDAVVRAVLRDGHLPEARDLGLVGGGRPVEILPSRTHRARLARAQTGEPYACNPAERRVGICRRQPRLV